MLYTDPFKTNAMQTLQGNQKKTVFQNDFHSALNKHFDRDRTYYNTSEKMDYVPSKARTKLKLWLHQPVKLQSGKMTSEKTYYSYDYVYDYSEGYHLDEGKGLIKLLELMHDTQSFWRVAVIWITFDKNPRTRKLTGKDGNYNTELKKVTLTKDLLNDSINLKVDGKNTLINLEDLTLNERL